MVPPGGRATVHTSALMIAGKNLATAAVLLWSAHSRNSLSVISTMLLGSSFCPATSHRVRRKLSVFPGELLLCPRHAALFVA